MIKTQMNFGNSKKKKKGSYCKFLFFHILM